MVLGFLVEFLLGQLSRKLLGSVYISVPAVKVPTNFCDTARNNSPYQLVISVDGVGRISAFLSKKR